MNYLNYLKMHYADHEVLYMLREFLVVAFSVIKKSVTQSCSLYDVISNL